MFVSYSGNKAEILSFVHDGKNPVLLVEFQKPRYLVRYSLLDKVNKFTAFNLLTNVSNATFSLDVIT